VFVTALRGVFLSGERNPTKRRSKDLGKCVKKKKKSTRCLFESLSSYPEEGAKPFGVGKEKEGGTVFIGGDHEGVPCN